MSWGRDKSWNHPSHFEYDSADLPFSPPSSGEAAYLESGLPRWKISSITDIEKPFIHYERPNSGTKDQLLAPLINLLTSRSHENVSSALDDISVTYTDQAGANQNQVGLIHSLPPTPLTTPVQTPSPTPQSSPLIHRKAEMEAVCKAALRCNQRLSQMEAAAQNPQNVKWYYRGFLSQVTSDACNAVVGGDAGGGSSSSSSSPSEVVAVQQQQLQHAIPRREASQLPKKAERDAGHFGHNHPEVPTAHDLGPQTPRRKISAFMSNRDMNFLAPTSM